MADRSFDDFSTWDNAGRDKTPRKHRVIPEYSMDDWDSTSDDGDHHYRRHRANADTAKHGERPVRPTRERHDTSRDSKRGAAEARGVDSAEPITVDKNVDDAPIEPIVEPITASNAPITDTNTVNASSAAPTTIDADGDVIISGDESSIDDNAPIGDTAPIVINDANNSIVMGSDGAIVPDDILASVESSDQTVSPFDEFLPGPEDEVAPVPRKHRLSAIMRERQDTGGVTNDNESNDDWFSGDASNEAVSDDASSEDWFSDSTDNSASNETASSDAGFDYFTDDAPIADGNVSNDPIISAPASNSVSTPPSSQGEPASDDGGWFTDDYDTTPESDSTGDNGGDWFIEDTSEDSPQHDGRIPAPSMQTRSPQLGDDGEFSDADLLPPSVSDNNASIIEDNQEYGESSDKPEPGAGGWDETALGTPDEDEFTFETIPEDDGITENGSEWALDGDDDTGRDGDTEDSEPSDDGTGDSEDNAAKPGWKRKIDEFLRQARDELHGGDEDTDPSEDTDDSSDDNAGAHGPSGDDDGDARNGADRSPSRNGDNGGQGAGNALNGVKRIISTPFKILAGLISKLFALIGITGRILQRVISIAFLLIIIWLILNIIAGIGGGSSTFESSDEGTVSTDSASYNDGVASIELENDSELIAHVSIRAEVSAWSPSVSPLSWLAPRTIAECSFEPVDVDPGKTVTVKSTSCDPAGGGVWKHVKIHVEYL